MICPNCGYRNAPGDAFCGSCGQFLDFQGQEPPGHRADWSDQPPAGGPTDETAVQPTYGQPEQPAAPPPATPLPPVAPPTATPLPPDAGRGQPLSPRARHSARPQAEGPPRMARPGPSGVGYGTITCWNCGRRNSASRTFCQQCGERLSVSSLAGAEYDEPGGSGGRARTLAIVLAVVAALLLAGGAATLFLGDSTPSPSPTPTAAAVVTESPPPRIDTPSPPPTQPPILAPTEAATLAPTAAPTAPPPATPINCADSTVPTNWVHLSGAERSARVRRNEIWCIHEVFIVPDPNFGDGTVRLRANDGVLARVTHDSSSEQSEYAFDFSPAVMVAGRQDVEYRMNCAGDFCNAVIQVGYELLRVP